MNVQNQRTYTNFKEYLHLKGRSQDTIDLYSHAVRKLDRVLGKRSFKKTTKPDINKWLKNMSSLTDSSQMLYKNKLKAFLKWLNNGKEPKCMKDVEIKRVTRSNAPEPVLSWETCYKIAKNLGNQEYMAFFLVLRETAYRYGELEQARIKDIIYDEDGMRIAVKNEKQRDKKIVIKKNRILRSLPELKGWIQMHPFADDPKSYLFCMTRPYNKDKTLNYTAFAAAVRRAARKAGVKQRVHVHLLRHSRLTELADKGVGEYHLCRYAGWVTGSRESQTYVSEIDTDRAVLEALGEKPRSREEKKEKKFVKCPWRDCQAANSYAADYCVACLRPMDSEVAEKAHQERKEYIEAAKQFKSVESVIEDLEFTKFIKEKFKEDYKEFQKAKT